MVRTTGRAHPVTIEELCDKETMRSAMHHFITAEGDGAVTSSASPDAGASVAFGPGNPFYEPSALPFQAPPFDKIRDSDYQPAIEAGMAQQLAEIQAIAASPEL